MHPTDTRMPLILASGSPRRRDLFSLMGVPFEIVAPEVDETCQGLPEERVLLLAQRKAEAALALYPKRLILAADTLVARGEAVLGKPGSKEEAVSMLLALSGGWHEVYTGVCLLDGTGEGRKTSFERTEVRFSRLDETLARAYVETGEPMDKAGAYAIQGRGGMFVEEIRGSASNVVGLPTALVRRMLASFGVNVLR